MRSNEMSISQKYNLYMTDFPLQFSTISEPVGTEPTIPEKFTQSQFQLALPGRHMLDPTELPLSLMFLT